MTAARRNGGSAAPPTPEEALVASFPHTLARTAKAWRRLMNERLAGLGLSQAKWTALLVLEKSSDGIKQCDLAGHMGIEGASLVGLLDRMAQDGWIERRPCAADRRAKLVFLSGKSRGTLEEIHRIGREVSRQLLGSIPASELAACERVLAAIGERAAGLARDAERSGNEDQATHPRARAGDD